MTTTPLSGIPPAAEALTTDNVKPSVTPSVWRVGDLTLAGVFIGLAELVLCVAALLVGKYHLGFGIDALRTVALSSSCLAIRRRRTRIERVITSGRRLRAGGW